MLVAAAAGAVPEGIPMKYHLDCFRKIEGWLDPALFGKYAHSIQYCNY